MCGEMEEGKDREGRRRSERREGMGEVFKVKNVAKKMNKNKAKPNNYD
jgi:hypothetical protein